MNEGTVQHIFSLAVLRTRYHSILPAWYRAAAASGSKERGCSQKFWGEFFSYNLHQSINSLDIQQFCFSFEGYSKILSWRVNRKRMGRRWSWSVLRYYPDICRDALRVKGKKVSLLMEFLWLRSCKFWFYIHMEFIVKTAVNSLRLHTAATFLTPCCLRVLISKWLTLCPLGSICHVNNCTSWQLSWKLETAGSPHCRGHPLTDSWQTRWLTVWLTGWVGD